MLDTAFKLETPEGAEVDVRPAGLFVRGIAFFVDEIIRWGVIIGALMIGGMLGEFGLGVSLIVMFLCYWLYGVIFEVFNGGQTPGKKMYGLQVVHDDGTPIRLPASMLRNILLTVDLMPAMYAVGIVTMVFTSGFRRVGDLVAGTMVVYRDALTPVPEIEVSGSRAPPVRLSAEEQTLFLSFLERKDALSLDRGRELAEILTPVLGCRGQQAVDEVLKIANGVRGGS